MKGRIHRMVYPLVFPFKLSYGTFYEREGLIIELSQDGENGYGEMSFVPYYGKDEEVIMDQMNRILLHLEDMGKDWTPWELYQHMMDEYIPDLFLMSAVDCALYDLYGKLHQEPVWRLMGASQKVTALSSLTITADDWEEKLSWNWPVLKLKMGFEGDMDLLKDIREKYSGDLRIDANSGWTFKDLDDRIDRLVEWRIELVEQPVDKIDDELLRGQDFPIPVVADESVQGPEDLDRIAEVYQVANLKLQKCGGITPAREMIRRCRELGLDLMAGCMTESSVGIGAMAQLGSFFDYLDLDGEYLIQPVLGDRRFVIEGVVELGDVRGIMDEGLTIGE